MISFWLPWNSLCKPQIHRDLPAASTTIFSYKSLQRIKQQQQKTHRIALTLYLLLVKWVLLVFSYPAPVWVTVIFLYPTSFPFSSFETRSYCVSWMTWYSLCCCSCTWVCDSFHPHPVSVVPSSCRGPPPPSCFFEPGFLCVALAVLGLNFVDEVGLEFTEISLLPPKGWD